MSGDLAIDALLMAVWRRKPNQGMMIHSDQGSQVSKLGLAEFPQDQQPDQQHESTRQLPPQRGSGEFFQLLKRERIRRKTYGIREDAGSDAFDYIEMIYNPKRRQSSAMQLSPVEYEKRYSQSLESA